MDKSAGIGKNLIASFDSSSTGSSDSEISYHKQLKTRHTLVKHGKRACNYDDLSVDTDRSDNLIDNNQDLSQKDMFISTLQEQLKKMEEMYKKKLDDSQALRHKFCRTAQELSDIKKICHIYEEENKKLRQTDINAKPENVTEKNNDANVLEKEYKELLKKIDTMENNTIVMKDLLEFRLPDVCEKTNVYQNRVDLNDIILMYKNIQNVLKEHNEKFNLLASKLNIQYNVTDDKAILEEDAKKNQTCSSSNRSIITLGTLPEVKKTSSSSSSCENKIDCMKKYNEALVEELSKKNKTLEEYSNKIKELELENNQLKTELENTNAGTDLNIQELNKIQEDLQEGSKTLQMCLCELKQLKDENKKNTNIQIELTGENDNLKKKLIETEDEINTHKQELEKAEKDAKIYKEKEEAALYCICELQKDQENKEKAFKEKRQKYRERINSLASSELNLKSKLAEYEATALLLEKVREECIEANKQVDEKENIIKELSEKIKTYEETEEQIKSDYENLVENLTEKCEHYYKELESKVESIKELETNNIKLQDENSKLLDHLNAANLELTEHKEAQEDIEHSLLHQNEIVNGERERVESEIEDAKILSTYLEEQLNISKKKYEELLPLTGKCCCEDITEIVFWLQKQNENLKAAQASLMENLQNKLAESRQCNNVDTFMAVKDILNFILRNLTLNTENEISDELKQAFEKLLEKRKVRQIETSVSQIQCEKFCECPASKQSAENTVICICKNPPSITKKISSTISTIIEEKEEDNNIESGDVETKTSVSVTDSVDSKCKNEKLKNEPNVQNNERSIQQQTTSTNQLCKETCLQCNKLRSIIPNQVIEPNEKPNNENITNEEKQNDIANEHLKNPNASVFIAKRGLSKTCLISNQVINQPTPVQKLACYENKFCLKHTQSKATVPHVCLSSPTASKLDINKIKEIECRKIKLTVNRKSKIEECLPNSTDECTTSKSCSSNGSENSEPISHRFEIVDINQQQNAISDTDVSDRTPNNTNQPTENSSLENIINKCALAKDSCAVRLKTQKVRHSSEKRFLKSNDKIKSTSNKSTKHCKSLSPSDKIELIALDTPTTSQNVSTRRDSAASTSKLEDYLNKLTKMEKQVGHLRRELSAGRINSTIRNFKLHENEIQKPKIYKHHQIVNDKNTHHDYHSKCFEPYDPGRASKKDLKKPKPFT